MIWWTLFGGKGRQWILPSFSKFPLRFGVFFVYVFWVQTPADTVILYLEAFCGDWTILQGPSLRSAGDHLVVSILTLPYPRSSKWFEHQIWIEFPKEQTDIDTLQFPLFQSNVIFNFNICESTRNFASLQSFPCPFFASNRGLAACVSTAGRIQTKQRRDAGWAQMYMAFLLIHLTKKIFNMYLLSFCIC